MTGSPFRESSLRARLAACGLLVGLVAATTVGTASTAHAGRPVPATRVVAPQLGHAAGPVHQVEPAAAHAVATTAKHSGHVDRNAAVRAARAQARKVLALAKRLRGRPYVWGAAGPHAFDCSGLVQYVFRRALGVHLPKGTWGQWAAIRHIEPRQAKPGDLVFAHNLTHVGIYAGMGYWWEAPRTGERVKKRRIWAWHPRFGRVIPRG